MSRQYQICSYCVMDTTDPDITFDDQGRCNHCRETEFFLQKISLSDEEAQQRLAQTAQKIKKAGEGKPYDCLIGLSGGVDSSYTAYLAHQLGLRPLAVHFDNGWNSELAVSNIKGIVQKLDYDLITLVIDWEEFRDLQRAFIRASVVDIEMLSDHAIIASMFKIARRERIRYVLSGTNLATESCMPQSWNWRKQDLRNIKAIHRRFGEKPLKSFPMLGSFWYMIIRKLGLGFEYVELLNTVNYKKAEAIKLLERELGWRNYGGKHSESLFTKFYQGYILPEKFGIDKRRVHWSSLICNGEATREEALADLENPPYDPTELEYDKEFVLKKLGFTVEEFDRIMSEPPRPHTFYPSDDFIIGPLMKLHRRLKMTEFKG